jgi:hypothetical protein
MTLATEFTVIPVNAYSFEENVAHAAPHIFPVFETSPLAKTLALVSDVDTHSVVNRESSSRIWADVWIRDHEKVDQTLRMPPRRDELDKRELKSELGAAFDTFYPTVYHFLGLEEYMPLLTPDTYAPLTRMHALARLYTYRPSVEDVAAIPGVKERLRALRLIDGFVPLRVANAMLPALLAWKRRGGGGSQERMLRNAVLLEHQGVPLEESARLLARYSFLSISDLLSRVGVPEDYLDAADGR